jgi:hypothetical protein
MRAQCTVWKQKKFCAWKEFWTFLTMIQPTVNAVPGVQIKYKGLFTMVDIKVVNAMLDNAAQGNCFICGCTPMQMAIRCGPFQPKTGTLEFGISPLHCLLRTFDWLLKFALHQDFNYWQARGANKAKKQARKDELKISFRTEFKVRLFEPRVGGLGNSHDGNTQTS